MQFRYFIICTTFTLACRAEQGPDASRASSTAAPLQAAQPSTAQPTTAAGAAPSTVAIGGLGSCQPSAELSALASRWVQLADADGNGSISRPEANTFSNFVLGGLFFRADTNADNVVTPAEGRAARAELLQQYPGLDTLLEQARTATGATPFKALATALDVEYGQPLSADEARKASQSALDELFRLADANKDATITLDEARTATWAGARAVGHQVFASVDANDDGRVALEEFQAAVSRSAKLAFDAADANDNQQLSQEEAAVAMGSIAHRLGVPAPL